jgi:hypothetical protein
MLPAQATRKQWEGVMASGDIEAVLAEFARTREEHLGHIIGLASVVACIRGVEDTQVSRVRGAIDELMLQFVGAKSDTRKAARSIADKILSIGREGRGPS